MNPFVAKDVSFKEWRPSNGHGQVGAEVLQHGFLRPLKADDPSRTLARIEAELRKGRVVSAFDNMRLLVLGPHHDSPYLHNFDEDMKQYNRRLV